MIFKNYFLYKKKYLNKNWRTLLNSIEHSNITTTRKYSRVYFIFPCKNKICARPPTTIIKKSKLTIEIQYVLYIHKFNESGTASCNILSNCDPRLFSICKT